MAEFDLQQLGPQEAYHLVTRIVAPRPIALVSSLDPAGHGNLAPFSYFTMGGSNPPSCIFCPVNTRDGKHKDTLRNVEQTGEYVINVCTRDIAQQMNQCSFPYPPGEDEFDRSGLTRAPSRLVRAPGVAQSPIRLECRLHQILRHGEGPLSSNYVVGQILLVHVQDGLLGPDGRPDDERIGFIGRLGDEFYTEVSPDSLFRMARPDRG